MVTEQATMNWEKNELFMTCRVYFVPFLIRCNLLAEQSHIVLENCLIKVFITG